MDVETVYRQWCHDELVYERLRDALEYGKSHEWLLDDLLRDLLEEAFVNGWLARSALG